MVLLTRYDWPGNVREMENLIERLVIMVDGDEIDSNLLPAFLCSSQDTVQGEEKTSFADRGDRAQGNSCGPGAQQMESDA